MRIGSSTWVLLVGATAALLLGTSGASAAECGSDADCAAGTVCEVVGGVACAEPAPCPAGEPCTTPEPCEPYDIRECVPAPCASDADCADGLTCLTRSWEECTAGAGYECPPDTSCPPTTAECTTQSESRCMPRWVAPCTTAADCGSGFQCVQGEECECFSGGSTGGTGDAGAPEPAPEPGCSCTPTGQMYCEPEQVPCSSAADCRSGWTCEANPDDSVCFQDPTTGATDCGEPTAPDMLCMPPYWELAASGGGRGEYSESDSATSFGASSHDSGSCSVSSPSGGAGDSGWLALGLLMGGAMLRRRR